MEAGAADTLEQSSSSYGNLTSDLGGGGTMNASGVGPDRLDAVDGGVMVVVDHHGAHEDASDISGELPNDMRFNSAHVISIVGYSALFMVSSVANLTVLNILVRRYRKNKSRVNLLLIHLAIADLLVTFLMMPLEIGWNATVMWTAGDVLCRVFSFFRIFGLFLSGNILICICLDRFYAIVCPLATGRAARNMRILLISAWVLAALSASPQVYIFHVEAHPHFTWYTQCVTFNSFPSPAYERLYTMFGMVFMYLVPLVVIIVTYTIILVTIRRKSKGGGGAGPQGSSASSASTSNGGGSRIGEAALRRSGAGVLNRARARTLKMTVVIVCVFIFCWTPYYIITLWFLIDRESFEHMDQRVQNFLFIFACTNSVMDPIVYGFFNLRKSGSANRGHQLQVNHTQTMFHSMDCHGRSNKKARQAAAAAAAAANVPTAATTTTTTTVTGGAATATTAMTGAGLSVGGRHHHGGGGKLNGCHV